MTGKVESAQETHPTAPRQLYRTMAEAADGYPTCGTGNTNLGVRAGPNPGDDVSPDARGMIRPGRGMSTFVHPKYLPKFLRPESLGGMSRLPVFWISEDDLSQFRRVTKKKHVQVEPSQPIFPATVPSGPLRNTSSLEKRLMNGNLHRYRHLEFAWTLARVNAGGRLTVAEEIVWTEAIGNIWRELTDGEREAIEAEPPASPTAELIDQELEIGESGQERTAA